MMSVLAGIGALNLLSVVGLCAIVSVHVWRHRKGRRPTRESQRTPECGDDGSLRQRARVGRPSIRELNVALHRQGYIEVPPGVVVITKHDADGRTHIFDVAWPENYTSIRGLLSDLTDGGNAILETERAR